MVEKQRNCDVMTKLNLIVKFLNKELKIRSIKDDSKNGLQVKASTEVKKVGLAVDACMEVFEKAKKLDCNLIVIHHGIFWKSHKEAESMIKEKIKFLKKNKISVYAAHLPLDKNRIYGNNVGLLKMLNMKPKELFAEVGYIGYLKKPRDIDSISNELGKKLKTKCKVWKFGKTKIKKIGVVSGSGRGDIPEAVRKHVDLFITGEVSHGSYHRAKDARLSIIIGGHYKTEINGVMSLGKLLERKFKIKTAFLSSQTGM